MNAKTLLFLCLITTTGSSLYAKESEPKFWQIDSDHVINIYDHPKLNAKVVGVISAKAYGLKNLGCSAKKSNAWCKIEYREQTGWIEARYLKEYVPEQQPKVKNEFTVDCEHIEYNDDKLICQDDNFKKLDEQMNTVFEQAQKVALETEEGKAAFEKLLTTQREWINSRHDCWKSDVGLIPCVKNLYENRISELQAHWKLIPSIAMNQFICEDNTEFFITEYETKPLASATVDYEGQRAVLAQTVVASGVKYVGANDRYVWLKGKEAIFFWDQTKGIQHCSTQDPEDS